MSGTGGTSESDWRPAGGGGSGGNDPCELRVVTTLNSPNPAVLGTLSVGERLNVVLAAEPTRVVAQTGSGLTAGSVTAPVLPQLIACLQSGRKYGAQVLILRGGTCEVSIELESE